MMSQMLVHFKRKKSFIKVFVQVQKWSDFGLPKSLLKSIGPLILLVSGQSSGHTRTLVVVTPVFFSFFFSSLIFFKHVWILTDMGGQVWTGVAVTWRSVVAARLGMA